jgi:hypothetical protein
MLLHYWANPPQLVNAPRSCATYAWIMQNSNGAGYLVEGTTNTVYQRHLRIQRRPLFSTRRAVHLFYNCTFGPLLEKMRKVYEAITRNQMYDVE